jgi:HPt (histidine-containing phosphotransfer) domain-containing protein
MSQTAHKLKGSCLNLGARQLAEVCRQIELKGKNGEASQVPAHTAVIKSIYEQTENALKQLVVNV